MVPFVSTAHEVLWVRERVMDLLDAANLRLEVEDFLAKVAV